jgi:hypothetical protein
MADESMRRVTREELTPPTGQASETEPAEKKPA